MRLQLQRPAMVMAAMVLLEMTMLVGETAARGIEHQNKSSYSRNAPFLGLPTVHRRNNWLHEEQKNECRNVHHAKDQCEFVRLNCNEDKVGMVDYLELYYCRLGHAKGVAFSVIALWLAVLFSTIGIAASDFFCVNLSTIASVLGMSESMAGVTFLAFGNGSPDVFSTFAAMKINSGSLAVGELIGAASFITTVVAGSMAIVRPFKVGRKSFVRDVSFFAVAVLFGLFFLADGKIKMWECVVMIIFYIFYVMFVIGWHWMSGRRKERRRKERRAREHHTAPEDEELLGEDPDDDDEDSGVGGNNTDNDLVHDFGALERAETYSEDRDEDEDDKEEQDQREFAELSNSMRLTRPPLDRNLTSTGAPHTIRPSLVGALEFRAVLHSLEKAKHQQGRQIHLRRYSDDPLIVYSNADGDLGDGVERDESGEYRRHTATTLLEPGRTSRDRAVSVNDASHERVDPASFPPQGTIPDLLISTDANDDTASISSKKQNGYFDGRPPSKSLDLPYNLLVPSLNTSPSHSPPSSAPVSPTNGTVPRLLISDSSLNASPFLSPTSPRSPRSISPTSRPTRSRSSTMRASRPPSLRLPRPSIDSSSTQLTPADRWPFLSYWPYSVLPPPQVLSETLFPTLRDLRSKSFLSGLLAVAAVPSVFLLTITLPVVDGSPQKPERLAPESPMSFATTIRSTPRLDALDTPTTPNMPVGKGAGVPTRSASREWNRWLVATQCITAPLFITLMMFTDFSTSPLLPILYALLAGLCSLGLLLVSTSPARAPRHHYLLCFAGFVVAIAWISSVAEEVVGVLKAFGVIFGISDAILGLTIFAVGNSLGDLVADITVARLGFPVMALSACFGGPMLNILLGVGISGLYMTLTHGGPEHKPYRIEVSSTLVISAATLLVTLVVLLVWVPINKWMMSRRIGWTIVGLWVCSTIANVVVEVMGIGSTWGRNGKKSH